MTFQNETELLRVVLVRTRNPLNIGAVARAMSNFGFSKLRVVCPYAPSFREARSATHAAEILARAEEFESIPTAIADCTLVVGTTAARERQLEHPLKQLDDGAAEIRARLAAREKVALLFGSEKRGLSNEDLSHCQWLMRIPTRKDHGSMNLGQSAAVCLYELAKTPQSNVVAESRSLATAEQSERLTTLLLEALNESGYFSAPESELNAEKVRRLIRRLAVESRDMDSLLGMLRQMIWKMKNK